MTGTQVERFPLPVSLPIERSRRLDRLAAELAAVSPATLCERSTPTAMALTNAHAQWVQLRGRMISEQEELDWDVYHRYGIITDAEASDVVLPDPTEAPGLASGERAFEIVLARRVAEGKTEAQWFTQHCPTPVTEVPKRWPKRYREVVERRIELIEQRQDLALIEHPDCKRRWNSESWEQLREQALREWLLDRMEARALWLTPHTNGNPKSRQRSVHALADLLRGDTDFISVAVLWASDALRNPNAELTEIMAALVETEHAPADTPHLSEPQGAMDQTTPAKGPRPERSGHHGSLDVPEERFLSPTHIAPTPSPQPRQNQADPPDPPPRPDQAGSPQPPEEWRSSPLPSGKHARNSRAPELTAALQRFGRPEAGGQIARAEEERLRVIADFPVHGWPELPLARYAMGTDVTEAPFCAVLEFHTPHLGSIRGGSARKHIIYRTNTGSWWLPSPLEDLDPHEAWRQLRREFVTALHAVRVGDFAELDALPLLRWGQALVTKTLAIYAPQVFLQVYSGEHLRHFIRLFGGTPLPGVPSWELNRQLKKLIDDDQVVGEWDSEEVLRFLYTHLDPRTGSDQLIKITPGENARLWDECLRDGVIRVGFDTGDLRQYTDPDGLISRLRAADPTRKETHLRSLARRLLRFRDLAPGTRIVANRGRSEILAVGIVTDDGYRYAAELPEYRNVLGVDWDTSYAQRLRSPARGWMSTFGNVSSSLWKTIQQGRGHRSQDASDQPPLPSDISQVLAALERKGQVILHGPPGTGKTRLALNTALALAGCRSALDADQAERAAALREIMTEAGSEAAGEPLPPVTLITFHPSLGYEDFVEGYKPTPSTAGASSLRCTDGVFHSLCSAAERDPDRTYLLIIDEINRADLPRVLGELVTLLELDKRDMELRLPVSGRPFRVPGNVRIIGTMNTADRSVAHLDAAIRRRFGFLAVPPDPTVVDTTVGALDVSAFLTELNRRISTYLDRDRQIGHAFLLHDDAPLDSTEQFSTAFYHDIGPLLEDYSLGDSNLLTRLLGPELVDPTGQIIALDPDDLAVRLAKEFGAGVDLTTALDPE